MSYPIQSKWKRLLLLHFAICSIGLIKLSMMLGSDIYKIKLMDFGVSLLGNTAFAGGVASKLSSLTQYMVALPFLFLFYGFVLWGANCRIKPPALPQINIIASVYFVVNIIFTAYLYTATTSLSICFLPWLALTFIAPLACLEVNFNKLPVLTKSVGWLLCAILMAQLWFIFQPLILKTMLIENDLMDIPGQTILTNGSIVDNTTFINQHQIGGVIKYDPRIDNGITPLATAQVTLKKPNELTDFIATNQDYAQYRYVLSDQGVLALKDVMPDEEHVLLRTLFSDNSDKEQIDKLYFLAKQQENYYLNRVYTPIEWDFIQKNAMELTDQSKLGWFFYHHNYMFGPVFAIANGADPHHQVMVYGWFATLFFVKALPFLGGVTYQNYFKLLFSLYPLYYLGFLALVFALFKRVEYVLLAALLVLFSIFTLGTQEILHGPGFNPLRHFFDIFAFFCFYRYSCGKRLGWLAASLSFAIVGLLFNREFGMFLLLAMSAATFCREIFVNRWRSIDNLIVFAALAIGLYLYALVVPHANPGYISLLFNVRGPGTPLALVKEILVLNSFCYLLAIIYRKIEDPINHFWLSVMFYCQFILLYVLWWPAWQHWFSVLAPFILLLLCLIYLSLKYLKWESFESRVLYATFSAVLAFLYVPSALLYSHDTYQYRQNFAVHTLYHWKFASAELVSTMDPVLFEHASALINQYSTAPGIYIISRYDDLLPILAGKYSAMPWPEMLTNLVKSSDVQFAADFIKQQKPEYLFVDADMDRSFSNEIYDLYDPMSRRYDLYPLSFSRVTSLDQLKAVFALVKNEYKPMDKSELITVYKKI